MNRRHFLRNAAAGTIALQSFPYHLFAGETKKYATDRIKLGPRGVETSRLAMGTGTDGVGGSSNQTRKLGMAGLAESLRCGVRSGRHLLGFGRPVRHPPPRQGSLEARQARARDHSLQNTRSTEKEMRADLDRFRRELGTDYIDILLLHCMMDDDWPDRKKGAMAVISEAQEKGIVRTHGTSCHTLGALKAAAANPWVEVDLARINPAQKQMDADPATVISVLKQMKAAGKGVIGMKILGAGALRNRVDESLQFALSQECVDCFTIGSESRAEMEDLLRKIPAASTRG